MLNRYSLLRRSLLIAVLLLMGTAISYGQGIVKGKVTDASTGEALPSATVALTPSGSPNAKKIGAIAKKDGSYQISAVAAGSYLMKVTYVGYKTFSATIVVNSADEIVKDIALQLDVKGLDEVVVTGVVTKRFKSEAEVSVSTVEPLELVENSYQDLSQLISGKATGVRVTTSSGNVGGGVRFDIRSGAGLTGNSQPVIYIDNVRIRNNEVGPDLTGGQRFSAISDINPNDFSSIDVLKGPAASALYGTSGANGVVLIKTRSGQTGGALTAPNFEYRFVYGENSQATKYTDDILSYQDANDVFKVGPFTEHSLNFSGSSETFKYYTSFTSRNEDGIMYNNDLKRNSIRANFSAYPSDKVTLNIFSNVIFNNVHLPQNDNNILGYLGNTALVGPEATGGFGSYGFLSREGIDGITTENSGTRVLGSVEVLVNPIEELTLRGAVGYNGLSNTLEQIYPADIDYSGIGIASGHKSENYISSDNFNVDLSAAYHVQASSDLSSTTTLGMQTYYSTDRTFFATKEEYPTSIIGNIGAGSKLVELDEGFSDFREAGIFLIEDLMFQEAYILSLGVRNDFASTIGESAPTIFYPRVGAAVLLHKLDVLPSEFDVFKLRAAYGQSGTLPGPIDGSSLRWKGAPSGYGTGADVSSVGNPQIEPERIAELELGFDIELLNSYGIAFTYFNQTSKQSFVAFNNPPSTGLTATSVPKNVGSMTGSGFESNLYGTVFRDKDYQLDLDLKWTYAKNEVTDLGGAPPIFQDENALVEGQPKAAFYTFKVLGALFDQDGKYVGANVDTVRSFLGNPVPEHVGSFTVSFRFLKNFTLNGIANWSLGGTIHNLTRVFQTQFGNDREYNTLLTQLGIANYDSTATALTPGSAEYIDAANKYAQLDFTIPGAQSYFESSDHLRISEVSLRYDFTDALQDWFTANSPVKAMSAVVGVRNLALFKGYSGPDVDLNYDGAERSIHRGHDFLTLQNPQTWYLSISLGF